MHTFGDLHLYSNHLEQAQLQLSREPRTLPQMKLNPEVTRIEDFKYEDFEQLATIHNPPSRHLLPFRHKGNYGGDLI